ncbi:MAG TPA: hypothetical protein PKG59_13140 [Spirochaetota bacterium]|nr:hypothetical protein [Spirochaetota bacterium]
MLYLSIALIAAGVLFILYSLMSSKHAPTARAGREPLETGPRDSDADALRDVPPPRPVPASERIDAPHDVRERHPLDDMRRSHEWTSGADARQDAPRDQPANEAGLAHGSDAGATDAAGSTDAPASRAGADDPASSTDAADGAAYAVLYEDASNVIDYYAGDTAIDPSLAAYSKIRRVGRGALEQARDGVNFYIGKKFYRYDFYRIADLRAGSGYLALSLKDSDTVRLFIFERGGAIASEIIIRYNEYKKGQV